MGVFLGQIRKKEDKLRISFFPCCFPHFLLHLLLLVAAAHKLKQLRVLPGLKILWKGINKKRMDEEEEEEERIL